MLPSQQLQRSSGQHDTVGSHVLATTHCPVLQGVKSKLLCIQSKLEVGERSTTKANLQVINMWNRKEYFHLLDSLISVCSPFVPSFVLLVLSHKLAVLPSYILIFMHVYHYSSLWTRSWTWTSLLTVEKMYRVCVWRRGNLGVSSLFLLFFCSFFWFNTGTECYHSNIYSM